MDRDINDTIAYFMKRDGVTRQEAMRRLDSLPYTTRSTLFAEMRRRRHFSQVPSNGTRDVINIDDDEDEPVRPDMASTTHVARVPPPPPVAQRRDVINIDDDDLSHMFQTQLSTEDPYLKQWRNMLNAAGVEGDVNSRLPRHDLDDWTSNMTTDNADLRQQVYNKTCTGQQKWYPSIDETLMMHMLNLNNPQLTKQTMLCYGEIGSGKTCNIASLIYTAFATTKFRKIFIFMPNSLLESFQSKVKGQCRLDARMKEVRYDIVNWKQTNLQKITSTQVPTVVLGNVQKDVATCQGLSSDFLHDLLTDSMIIVDEAHWLRESKPDSPSKNVKGFFWALYNAPRDYSKFRCFLFTGTPIADSWSNLNWYLHYILMGELQEDICWGADSYKVAENPISRVHDALIEKYGGKDAVATAFLKLSDADLSDILDIDNLRRGVIDKINRGERLSWKNEEVENAFIKLWSKSVSYFPSPFYTFPSSNTHLIFCPIPQMFDGTECTKNINHLPDREFDKYTIPASFLPCFVKVPEHDENGNPKYQRMEIEEEDPTDKFIRMIDQHGDFETLDEFVRNASPKLFAFVEHLTYANVADRTPRQPGKHFLSIDRLDTHRMTTAYLDKRQKLMGEGAPKMVDYYVLEGDTTAPERAEIMDVIREELSPDVRCLLIIGSKVMNEGFDLMGFQTFHSFSIPYNATDYHQAEGRTIRRCSGLNDANHNVDLYYYLLSPREMWDQRPELNTPRDTRLFLRATLKDALHEPFLITLQNISIESGTFGYNQPVDGGGQNLVVMEMARQEYRTRRRCDRQTFNRSSCFDSDTDIFSEVLFKDGVKILERMIKPKNKKPQEQQEVEEVEEQPRRQSGKGKRRIEQRPTLTPVVKKPRLQPVNTPSLSSSSSSSSGPMSNIYNVTLEIERKRREEKRRKAQEEADRRLAEELDRQQREAERQQPQNRIQEVQREIYRKRLEEAARRAQQ